LHLTEFIGMRANEVVDVDHPRIQFPHRVASTHPAQGTARGSGGRMLEQASQLH
jgi:hypothetical protein